MPWMHSHRKNCRDVFNAFLVTSAQYAGLFEIPVIQRTNWIPNRLISFSKAISSQNHDQWIHFYEDDYLFERVWRNPKKYINTFKSYNGVILPDFSLFRDMPLNMQIWNIFRSRAIGHWLQLNGIKVIVNVRFGDERTYALCCDGIQQHGSIAISTHGSLKHRDDKAFLLNGLQIILCRLQPDEVIIYGRLTQQITDMCKAIGANIHQFESEFTIGHKVMK